MTAEERRKAIKIFEECTAREMSNMTIATAMEDYHNSQLSDLKKKIENLYLNVHGNSLEQTEEELKSVLKQMEG